MIISYNISHFRPQLVKKQSWLASEIKTSTINIRAAALKLRKKNKKTSATRCPYDTHETILRELILLIKYVYWDRLWLNNVLTDFNLNNGRQRYKTGRLFDDGFMWQEELKVPSNIDPGNENSIKELFADKS